MSPSRLFMILAACFLLLLLMSRNHDMEYQDMRGVGYFAPPVSSPLFLFAVSGQVPTLAADFQVLRFFDVYYAIQKHQKKDEAIYLVTYLKNASLLDPYFFDIYRLASGLLPFDLGLAEQSIHLLERGAEALPDNWEIPFFAGFIAHQQLGDDKTAFRMMKLVIDRPNAPDIAVHLAAKFLAKTNSKADAILFLQSLLLTMPESYREDIKRQIQRLRSEEGY